ncbi:hypothetical protein P171DRAFT_445107 [Karstenula rhodostoma CBS 690.94]|uniref:Uncharacterized protein n=1 Tax=Karstenula rhodostoma CBS 690.94 TaxID=1392251 RepID=A0A9P4PIG1_9PLEO|nr:hypothetical protein P171DRAFT_445107 [Karstenula rhodostoma CBS 690.94]
MSSPPSPNPPSSSKVEPLGWDFEDVKFREVPIPDTWWFIPWGNTSHCENDADSPYPDQPEKLLYYDVHPIKEQYRGSGIVIEETEGRVVGCYKVRADTEAGDDAKTEVAELKHRQWLEERGLAPVERVHKRKPKRKPTLAYQDDSEGALRLGGKKYDGKPLTLPNEIRRLNGLILDPRPARIALHPKDKEAFRIYRDMARAAFKKYGARYQQLEIKIRNAMKDTFDKKFDLPVYRLKQIKAAKKAGHPEVRFTEEEESSESEEEEVEVKDEKEEEEYRIYREEVDRRVMEEDGDVGGGHGIEEVVMSTASSPLSSVRSR